MPKIAVLPLVVAVLLAGCAASTPPPQVKSVYLGSGAPIARPDTSRIYAFRHSDCPSPSQYTVIGQVEVTTVRLDYGERELLSFAEAEALKLGGEAIIIDVTSRPTGTRSALPAGANDAFVGGQESGHQVYSAQAGSLRQGKQTTLKATVIIWKRGE